MKFLKHIIQKFRIMWNYRHSLLFDEKWYLEHYPKCKNDILPPYWYYIFKGYKQGHDPSPRFSGELYWAIHYYNVNRNRCPLIHYALHDKEENLQYYHSERKSEYILGEKNYPVIPSHCVSNKRILLICHELSLTGAPLALINLAETLQHEGVYVVILSLKPGPLQKELSKRNLQNKTLLLPQNCNQDGCYKAFARYASNFDAILLNTLDIIYLVEYLKGINVQRLCWIHEGTDGFRYNPRKMFLSQYLSLYDTVCSVSNYSTNILRMQAQYHGEVQPLFYYIDDIAQETTFLSSSSVARSQKFRMVIAGTICDRKGHGVLLQSIRYIPQNILQDIEILIAGPRQQEELTLQIEKSHCCAFKLLGALSHDALLQLMCTMDILLCPSMDDPMPIVCTEAFMLRKPVIVGSNTGTSQFVENNVNGYIVESGNAKALADVIIRAYKNKEHLPNMGFNARHIFEENFTKQMFIRNIREIFHL